MDAQGRVDSVNIARVESFALPGGESFTSAIRKRPQPGPVRLTQAGFEGDASHNPAHGGPNRAVHVFASEHRRHFEKRAGRALPIPTVGENLTLSGWPDAKACVGDVLAVGSARLQITMPTERCRYPGTVIGEPRLLKWMIEDLRTGYYLRVVEAGEVAPGDEWRLEERGCEAWSIEALSRAMLREVGDPEIVARLQALPELASEWTTRLAELHERRRSG